MLSITDRFTSKKAGRLALLFDVRMWISFLNEKEEGAAIQESVKFRFLSLIFVCLETSRWRSDIACQLA